MTGIQFGKENVMNANLASATKRKARSWDQSYAELVRYREKNGNANVPYPFPQDTALGAWVKNQRIYEQKLSEERHQRLMQIGFEFSRRATGEEHWKQTFNELKKYKTTSECLPHHNSDNQLGQWASNQRRRLREGTAQEARQQMLSSIGFVTQDNERPDPAKYGAIWQKQYDKLQLYHNEHGDCNITSKHEDTSLYQWVCRQRYLYNKNLMPAERKEMLDALGFDWNSNGGRPKQTRQQEWDEHFEKIVLFQEQNPTKKLRSAPRTLSGWLTTQKTRFREGDMDPFRAEKLIGIGFQPPTESDRSWNGRYQQLKGIATWEDLKKDLCMKRWVQLQRFLHEKELLSNERTNRLDAIGFQWDAAADAKMPRRRSSLTGAGKKGLENVEPTPRKRRGPVNPTPRKRRGSATDVETRAPKRRMSLTGGINPEDLFAATPIKRHSTPAIPEGAKTGTKKRRSSLLTGARLQF